MLALWSPQRRHGLWRRLWLALAEAERSLGVPIPDEAISQMRAHLDDIDFTAVASYEKRFRHDVMAHVHAFGDVAPAARGFIHYGATSCYVTDNAELILMREGLALLRAKVVDALRELAGFARTWRDQPTLGYTHLQPAQLTTVGKRAALWMQDLVLDLAELDHRVSTLPFRGVKGTTGTQASFLEIFGGDHAKVRELDRRVCAAMGFATSIPVSGQTYTRKIDAQVLGVVAGIAASAAKFASDLRMLQAFGEIEEPFEKEQIGSSAMAYKRNPMRCERINSLARFVASLEPNANQTHAVQYFERTLDDSANRRLVIPESFLATDAILVLLTNVAGGLEVHPARITARVRDELPFMATEELIVRAVRAGKSRQDAHEVIRVHSIAAARAMKDEGVANDMLERLTRDPAFGVAMDDITAALDASRFVGRAPQQVDDFLAEVVDPLLAGLDAPAKREEVRV
ncbi:MAG: adenylosuccinate lyase [Gemmatimonadetes bacterium]|nr:adenylosuccinate lyase [Gemmatimonadota bacterium]MBK6841918.1 adenylosuccinate lyase [Gemmatimonadota bacterium]MBK9406968.1 adenylosuccinate lyase [Gemmatimonadota bacterium]MBK9978779.1 adenylosuccinate lyase [Gemmatimonadota bacterium]MBP9107609.1 adenylosuccinate lyase [Gemmatimonadaceae bacterium]